MAEEWITTGEAAEFLRVTRRHVTELARQGKLKARRDGKNWLIHSSLSAADEEAEDVPQGMPEEAQREFKEQIDFLKEQIQQKNRDIRGLQTQLEEQKQRYEGKLDERDRAIEEAHREAAEARNRHDTIVLQLTRQVQQAQEMAAYWQQPFWRRWRRRKQLPEATIVDEEQ